MDCPKCLGKLNKVDVKFHEIADMPTQKGASITTLEVDQCFVCNGVWFDAGELEKYIQKKLTILDSPAIDIKILSEMDAKTAKCPHCNMEMLKKSAPLNKNITIDFCEKCKGVWLDSTEIDRIEAKNISFKEKLALALRSLFHFRQ